MAASAFDSSFARREALSEMVRHQLLVTECESTDQRQHHLRTKAMISMTGTWVWKMQTIV